MLQPMVNEELRAIGVHDIEFKAEGSPMSLWLYDMATGYYSRWFHPSELDELQVDGWEIPRHSHEEEEGRDSQVYLPYALVMAGVPHELWLGMVNAWMRWGRRDPAQEAPRIRRAFSEANLSRERVEEMAPFVEELLAGWATCSRGGICGSRSSSSCNSPPPRWRG